MSLNDKESSATRSELRANFLAAGMSTDQAARDLGTTPEHLADVLDLRVARIEEPWVLRNYLTGTIREHGGEPVPFTKLVGNPANYWFLDVEFIDAGQLMP